MSASDPKQPSRARAQCLLLASLACATIRTRVSATLVSLLRTTRDCVGRMQAGGA